MRNARIFISYSRGGKGPQWKAALLRALHVFERHHLLDVWHDGKIRDSLAWQDEIEKAMADAGVAIVLLTPEALNSQFIVDIEFPVLSNRQHHDGLPVFPVICENCEWKAHDWLRATQAPNASKPLAPLDVAAQDRVFRKLATDIAEELSRVTLAELPRPDRSLAEDRIYLDRFLLAGGPRLHEEKLIGRGQELALLDLAFAQPDTAIVSLVASGGVGKTMLVQHWLRRLERQGWFGAHRVYAWSSYSQGTKEDRQASEDSFLAHALQWFGVKCEPTLSPWDKGRLLADAVASEPALLILDGIEPLQYPPGPRGGGLRAPGVQSLLKQLARRTSDAGHRALCLVTTREQLTDLSDFERRPNAAWGSVLRVDLGNLTEEAGAALLHHAGAKRAGAAEIKADDEELLAASLEVGGHALTLNLLGRFLARAHGGDIRRRDLVKFEEADRSVKGGTTFRMLAAFEDWFANEGEIEARSLAVLRLLGLFDRPADKGCIGALRNPPIMVGLTEALFTVERDASTARTTDSPLSDKAWHGATSYLADFGLLAIHAYDDEREEEVDCHPLIREHFGKQIQDTIPQVGRAAHRRLYEHLKSKAEPRPSSLAALEPLYQAVTHGCRAAMPQQVHDEVYSSRILRGAEHFSWHQLGAFGAELNAQACFFDLCWTRPTNLLSEPAQAWILNEAAFCLRASGRLTEAVEPMRVSLRMNEADERWADAAICAGNLSEVQLTLGEVASALWIARRCVMFSDASRHGFYQRRNRTILGQALHCAGLEDEALEIFREAEIMQSEHEPFPLLYSLLNARYCDLILAVSERAAWKKLLNPRVTIGKPAIEACRQVKWRAQMMFGIREPEDSLIEIAFDHITLGRAALCESMLDTSVTGARESATEHVRIAVDAFHRAGQQEFEGLGLLSRSWLHFLEGDLEAAGADLNEAWQIAERGAMRLLMADIALHRARILCSRNDLAQAREIITSCGYWRRYQELEDAIEASKRWPSMKLEA